MLFHVNTHPFSLHIWRQLLQKTNLSDNMQNWFNFDPYLCNCLIWQACYKLYKVCFLYRFYRPNKKTAKIWCFAPTSPFYIIFIDGLSIWTYPFITMYLNVIKTFHLFNSKNILGKFYATTAPCFWKMHLLVLLKLQPFWFYSKKEVLAVSFLLHQMLLLSSRINHLYKRDY